MEFKCLDCKIDLYYSYYNEDFFYIKGAFERHDQNGKHIGFVCDNCAKIKYPSWNGESQYGYTTYKEELTD